MLNTNLIFILVLLLIIYVLKDNVNNYLKTKLTEKFQVMANNIRLSQEITSDNDVLSKFLKFNDFYNDFKEKNKDLSNYNNQLDLLGDANGLYNRLDTLTQNSNNAHNSLSNNFNTIRRTIDDAKDYYNSKQNYIRDRKAKLNAQHSSKLDDTVNKNKDSIGKLFKSQDNKQFISKEVIRRAEQLSSDPQNIANIENLYKNYIQSFNTKLDNNSIVNNNEKRFKEIIDFKKLFLPREDLSEYNGVLVRTYELSSPYVPNTNQAENILNEYIVPSISYIMVDKSQSYFSNSKGVNQYIEFFGFIKIPSGANVIEFNVRSSSGARLFFGSEILIDEFRMGANVNHNSRKVYVEPLSKIPYKLLTFDSNPSNDLKNNFISLNWKINTLGNKFDLIDSSYYYLPNLKYD